MHEKNIASQKSMPACLPTNNVKTCAKLAALEQTTVLTTLGFIGPIEADKVYGHRHGRI